MGKFEQSLSQPREQQNEPGPPTSDPSGGPSTAVTERVVEPAGMNPAAASRVRVRQELRCAA